MRLFSKQFVPFLSNSVNSIIVPDYSQILDINVNSNSSNLPPTGMTVFYQYDSENEYHVAKTFIIYQLYSNLPCGTSHNPMYFNTPSEDFVFFKTLELKTLNSGFINNVNSISLDISENVSLVHIFIKEVKSASETREEKLNEIL